MKKVVAILLALSMVLTMAFAVAETATEVSTYMMVYAVDAEGNALSLEDGALPILVLAIASDGTCAFGTEDNGVEGTYEIVAGEDGVYVLYVALADGTETVMFYEEENDAWVLTDEESGIVMFLYNIETLAEAVAE